MHGHHGMGRRLLTSAALSTGVLLIAEGCFADGRPAAAHTSETMNAMYAMPSTVMTVASAAATAIADSAALLAVALSAPKGAGVVVSTVVKQAPKPLASCVRHVKRRVGNGKGASYVDEVVDRCATQRSDGARAAR